jgi:membrane associated rhomboid family serine protease
MSDDGRIERRGGPWGARDPDGPDGPQDGGRPAKAREPMFNAPWPATALVGALVGSYAAQAWLGGGRNMAAVAGFAPEDLVNGRWWTILLALVIHASWMHVLSNALGALIFGPPVARLFGPGLKAAGAFFLFFVICGVIASLGWAAIHWGQPVAAAGASGAVFGLIGAASRLYGRETGISPIFSPLPVGMAVAFLVVNLLYGIFGTPLMQPGVVVAWEAHVVGFVAGLLLVGPFARALGRA